MGGAKFHGQPDHAHSEQRIGRLNWKGHSMNATKLVKFTGACALALGCTTVTPTFAQTEGTTPQNQGQADDRDWGWVGLFGLIGLAGLAGRKRDTHHYDTTHGTTTAR